ncbi:MAG: flotillin family protein, partial [Ketobacter sp.]|nr:flotillin family protein [Ketobacter sp.]
RTKQAMIITAEAEAQELLVKDIKAAEAAEKAAEHKGREQLVLADAKLKASDMHAKAQIRMAEGTRAEHAAVGLAEAEVKEADAVATEKHGLAEVRVKEADAVAVEKLGLAEASILRQKGLAEGEAIREQLVGEAKGLTEKAEAMKALDDAARGHEEYRLRLEAEKEIALKGVDVRREIAEAQAMVLSEGLKSADIDIVGGDDIFFDRLIGAVGMGKAVDGFIDKSDATQKLLGDYLSGDSSFTGDLKGVLTQPNLSSG